MARRTRVLDQAPRSSPTSSVARAANPSPSPSSISVVRSPARALPKRKFCPTRARTAPSSSTRTSLAKRSGVNWASAWSKVLTTTRTEGNGAPMSSILRSSGVSTAGGLRPSTTAGGGVERQRDGLDARRLGLALGPGQHLDVPPMNPVEIADRAEGRFSRVGGRRHRAQGAPFCYFRRKRASCAEFGYESTVTPDEVMAEVKSGQARPVYLVTGEEQYLV